MQNDTATSETTETFTYHMTHQLYFYVYIKKNKIKTCPHKDVYTFVHNSIIHSGPKLEAKHMFINKRRDKQEQYIHTNQNYSTYEDSGKCNPFSKGKTFNIRQNDPNIRITKDLKTAMTITTK